VDSPGITGYSRDRVTVSGTIDGADVTVTVTYTEDQQQQQTQQYTLTINYEYADGRQAAPAYVSTLNDGDTYTVDSPGITGYSRDRVTVSGTIDGADVTVTVTYTANQQQQTQQYTLTINYVYVGGGAAATAYVSTLNDGATYNVTSPTVEGYTRDKATVSGTINGADVDEIVTYTASVQSSGPLGGGGGGGGATTATIADEEVPLTTIEDEETPLAAFITDRIAYIAGYPDGTVHPDGNLTRAEVAAMLFRLLSDAAKNDPLASTFTDVEDGKWYTQAIAYLASTGILTGYEDGSFKPNAPITRAEFAAIISRFDASQDEAGEARFSDVTQSHWAFKEIDNAAEKGWVNGYPEGTFKPQNAITRAEAVTAINNMLIRELTAADVPADAPRFTDLAEGHWAYTDIIEAAYDWVAAAEAAATEDEATEGETDGDAEATTTEEAENAEETTDK
ncbi:MAG: S-layer homology domain-containing protein, partial [Clostridiales Family XIII bacterium]|jgi:hypothetical protein|nr:S-layer homology domain-containing protein [Clostridiales Family XIII bacterium]